VIHGPLVLDELHALGHSLLPVINKNLDNDVGILHLRDLLSLDIRNSMTAESAMEKKVFYINQNDTLEHALAIFLKARHHLCIVTNDALETVGLVTLEDVMEALIGRRIISEEGNQGDR
jgi:CBS domain containing-hemolysin-like protein